MNDNIDPETPVFNKMINPDAKVKFFNYAKKGFVSGFAGLAVSVVATVPPQVADGVFTFPELMFTVTCAIGAGVVGFFAAYIPKNESR